MQAIPFSFAWVKDDSKMIVWQSKKESELIWLHLLNVTLLLIRAVKLGKENDNLALLVKEKMGRICSGTGVFLLAGQSWKLMEEVLKHIFPLPCMSY